MCGQEQAMKTSNEDLPTYSCAACGRVIAESLTGCSIVEKLPGLVVRYHPKCEPKRRNQNEMKHAKQRMLPGVVPPLSVTQEAAMVFLGAEAEAKDAKEKANKRKDEMIASALKAEIQTIKVKDDDGYVHTFEIESRAAVKHTSYLEVKVEKCAA
jgi:hypothetical protein